MSNYSFIHIGSSAKREDGPELCPLIAGLNEPVVDGPLAVKPTSVILGKRFLPFGEAVFLEGIWWIKH